MIKLSKPAQDAFYYMTWRNFFRNIKQIPAYFRHRRFLLKHGYPMSASWSVHYWFTSVMPEIIERLRDDGIGYPASLDFYSYGEGLSDKEIQDKAAEKWNSILTELIDLCRAMDENDKQYEKMNYKEVDEKVEKAKDEFFKLFSEWFFNLWD